MKRLGTGGAVLLACALAPVELHGQGRIRFEPSLEIVQIDDDNLNFSFETPMRDRVHRVTPSLSMTIESDRWSVRSSYGLDTERYAKHSDLDDPRARQRASAAVRYQASRRLALAINSDYMDTNSLADLDAGTGLATFRTRAQQLMFRPSATFLISPTTSAEAWMSNAMTTVETGTDVHERTQSLGFESRINPRNVMTIRYQHRDVTFGGGYSEAIRSYVVQTGWMLDLGRRSRFTLEAGPRITNGIASADIAASLSHRWQSTSLSVSLAQTEQVAIGHAATVQTQSVQTKFTWKPDLKLSVSAAPEVFRSGRNQFVGTVYRLGLGVQYEITTMLRFDVDYKLDTQKGSIEQVWADAELSRATLSVGLGVRPWRERCARCF